MFDCIFKRKFKQHIYKKRKTQIINKKYKIIKLLIKTKRLENIQIYET